MYIYMGNMYIRWLFYGRFNDYWNRQATRAAKIKEFDWHEYMYIHQHLFYIKAVNSHEIIIDICK